MNDHDIRDLLAPVKGEQFSEGFTDRVMDLVLQEEEKSSFFDLLFHPVAAALLLLVVITTTSFISVKMNLQDRGITIQDQYNYTVYQTMGDLYEE